VVASNTPCMTCRQHASLFATTCAMLTHSYNITELASHTSLQTTMLTHSYNITPQNISKLWSREQHGRAKLGQDMAAFTTCGKLGNGPRGIRCKCTAATCALASNVEREARQPGNSR